jgi:hypothetical protein
MRNSKLLDDHFGDIPYRHVRLGEMILANDVFVVNWIRLHNAKEVGQVLRQDHWPHYRATL